MVNILVPTDFSDLSKVALNFAIGMANKLDGTVTLLHVVDIVQPTRASMRLRLESLQEEIMTAAEEDMEDLLAKASKAVKLAKPVKTKISKGTPFSDVIKREAKKLHADLIVMGTHGASGLKKVVLGSNTSAVIEACQVPVLVVPELGQFKNFKNIVYVTDITHLQKEVKSLLFYAHIFGSTVHVFHITPTKKEVEAAEQKIEKILSKTEYDRYVVKVVSGKDVSKELDAYVQDVKADLLTTFTHEHSLYEKLFNRSLTRRLTFQSKTPLLAFRQKK